MSNKSTALNNTLVARLCVTQKSLHAQEAIMESAERHKKHLESTFKSLLAEIKCGTGYEEAERIIKEKDDNALINRFNTLREMIQRYFVSPNTQIQSTVANKDNHKVTVLSLAMDYLELNKIWLTAQPDTVYPGQMGIGGQPPIDQLIAMSIKYCSFSSNTYLERDVWLSIPDRITEDQDKKLWEETVFIVDYCLSHIVSGLLSQFSRFGNMVAQPYGMGTMPQSQMPMGGFYSAPMSATNGFDLNPEPPKATW